MGLVFNYQTKVNTIPGSIENFISKASHLQLQLIILLSSEQSLLCNIDNAYEEIACALEASKEDVIGAIQFWKDARILVDDGFVTETKVSQIEKSSKPQYTGAEIAEIVEKNDLRPIIDECAEILGVTFNTTDSSVITTLFHHLNISEDYLCTLCSYCASIDKRNLAYIQRMAYNLYDEGIDDNTKLESYLEKKVETDSFNGKIATIFGITSRALTSKEKKAFEKWQSYNYGQDIISKAYEITVEKTGKYTLSYLDKIVDNWHDAGYVTIDEIEKAQEENKESQETQKGSFDTNEFFEAALQKSRDSIFKSDS